MSTVAQMKTLILQRMKRPELTDRVSGYLDSANERINYKFRVELVIPQDDQPLPARDQLYLWAGVQAGFEDLNNGDNAIYAADRFREECRLDFINGAGTSTDQFGGDPPVIIAGG